MVAGSGFLIWASTVVGPGGSLLIVVAAQLSLKLFKWIGNLLQALAHLSHTLGFRIKTYQ